MKRCSEKGRPFVLLADDFAKGKLIQKHYNGKTEYWYYGDVNENTGLMDGSGKFIYKKIGVALKVIIVCDNDFDVFNKKVVDGNLVRTSAVQGMKVTEQDINIYLAETGRHADNVWINKEKVCG